MERGSGALVPVVVLVFVAALAWSPLVSADTQILDPGVPFEIEEHIDAMAYIDCNWSAPAGSDINFVVLGPDDSTLVDTTASSYDSVLLSPDSGNYRFRWTNAGNASVTLTYDIVSQSTGIDDTEQLFDTIFLGILVGAVVVVIILVLVVVVAMRGGKRPRPLLREKTGKHPSPGEPHSTRIPAMCPRCGSHIDSHHVFCPKCGHRVR